MYVLGASRGSLLETKKKAIFIQPRWAKKWKWKLRVLKYMYSFQFCPNFWSWMWFKQKLCESRVHFFPFVWCSRSKQGPQVGIREGAWEKQMRNESACRSSQLTLMISPTSFSTESFKHLEIIRDLLLSLTPVRTMVVGQE